ncbi:MAG: glycosyltransferase family 4 protein [Chloroflexi bacterium]|nr:MAG: glycosyltransferase family 4 protein [Chloroflexota bacterium]
MAKPIQVLMIVENCHVPGDQRVWNEATLLRDNGFEVSIICPKGDKVYQESYVCIEDIHIYRYHAPVVEGKYLSYIVEYSNALLKIFLLSMKILFMRGFDVIHVANPPDFLFLLGLCYRPLGKKFVFDQHDLMPELFKTKFGYRLEFLYKLHLFFEWCSYQTAHLVIVTNETQKRVAIERSGRRSVAHKVFVVRNGPNLNRIKPVAPEIELKQGKRYLLAYLGVMEVQDGVEHALYAVHDLVYKRNRQDVFCVLMGNGGHVAQLTELAHTLGLDEYTKFTGWTDAKDIVRYLTVADIALSPDPKNGLNETCTMVKTMEYMAMGKPVVAFDLAETRFSAQDAALYATPNVVEEFAEKIEQLLDDEELRVKCGSIGRKRVEEELHWGKMKGYLLCAYEALFLGEHKSYGQLHPLTKSGESSCTNRAER